MIQEQVIMRHEDGTEVDIQLQVVNEKECLIFADDDHLGTYQSPSDGLQAFYATVGEKHLNQWSVV